MADLQCMLHQAGTIARDRPAIYAPDIRIGYGEFDLMVSATAAWLRTSGVNAGQRVALYMENNWAAATLVLALIRIGAVPAPLSTRLPVKAVRQQLDRIDCRTLIARVRESSRKVLDGITCLDPDGLIDRTLTTGQAQDCFVLDSAAPASIVFTSGQSGTPKAVVHSYGNHYYSALGVNRHLRLRSSDCWLLSLPLYHVGGLGILFRCLHAGAALATMTHGQSLVDALTAYPVTHCSLVPTQLRRLLEAGIPTEKRTALRAVVVGGGPVAPALLDEARRAGWPVLASYGSTEMTSQITAGQPTKAVGAHHHAGRVLPYRELRLAADGEIEVRGATFCLGYATGAAVHAPLGPTGWWATGDYGRLDAQGNLQVTGRKDHMFCSGGENIQPEEIEAALLALPGIMQAVVVPVPHADYGQRPMAFIEDTRQRDASALRAALTTQLPAFKIPDQFHAWPTQLASHGIKPPRSALAQQAQTLAGNIQQSTRNSQRPCR